jgi:predicted metalloprotease with PDZ domain
MKSKFSTGMAIICLFIFAYSNLFSLDNTEIRTGKKRAYLGIYLQDLTPKVAKKMNIEVKEGALVTRVEKESPADSAGIKEDDIIVEVNGRQIYDADDLVKTIGREKPGEKVNIIVNRKGEKKTLSVVLGKNPRDKHIGRAHVRVFNDNVMTNLLSSGTLGLELMDLNDQLAAYFGAPKDKGLLVKKVEEKSEAEKAGLKAGDILLNIGKEDISDMEDVWDALEDYEKGDKVDIEVLRKGSSVKLSITLEEDFGDNDSNIYFKRGVPFKMNMNLDHIKDIYLDNLKDVQVEIEKLKPELEEMSKHIQIKIGKDLDKIKPELQRLKREIRNNIRWDIRRAMPVSI